MSPVLKIINVETEKTVCSLNSSEDEGFKKMDSVAFGDPAIHINLVRIKDSQILYDIGAYNPNDDENLNHE